MTPTTASNFSTADHIYMAEAVQLAERGRYSTSPNPAVGCLLVETPPSGGSVIARGWHQKAGEGHAEVNALREARELGMTLSRSTAYVTLEPCSHQGKTPPCAEALVDAGVARVVYGMQDPNPQVAGRGLTRLQEVGIKVDGPLQEAACRALNPGFIKRMQTGLPRVFAKTATSLDGRTAMQSGESQWITGPDARADVQKLRAQSCAIITGVGTVLADNPAMTVRDACLALPDQLPRQPLRVIVDSQLRLDPDSRILHEPGDVLVVYGQASNERIASIAETGAETLQLANDDNKVDLSALIDHLGQRQCNEVMVESGAKLLGALVAEQLVDEIFWYMAPTLLGSDARPAATLPFAKMNEQIRLEIIETRQVGADCRWHLKPKYLPAMPEA
ncbi:Riboflavin biosynthesis protein RibD [BD1-7 clade bacterium]|uniref:Riboflavin biosynthesis protein RibD n=1 Tax=BD1-7 clade bacterium TaxID=2029982 RepID=A0A5S9N0A8_9GAMM|nr:Riboflavin biosynthesis protein RibD [BD1-7 clade bacterium]